MFVAGSRIGLLVRCPRNDDQGDDCHSPCGEKVAEGRMRETPMWLWDQPRDFVPPEYDGRQKPILL